MTDEQQVPAVGPDINSRELTRRLASWRFRAPSRSASFSRASTAADIDDAELSGKGVVGYYWQAHNLKLQADVGQLGYGANFATMSSLPCLQGLQAWARGWWLARPGDTRSASSSKSAF